MTPEQDIERAIAEVCPDSGHWPYTRKSSLYVGFKPYQDGPFKFSGDRAVRVAVTYDVVVCADRSRLSDAEVLRFALYKGLRDAGWALADNLPGYEIYNAQTQMYQWGFSVIKGFALDEYGQPQTVE